VGFGEQMDYEKPRFRHQFWIPWQHSL